jgi:cell wall-associated NlpC family hydrolase
VLPGEPQTAGDGYAIAGTALGYRGTPYRNGGSDPSGFDCSGFIWYVFGQHGIRVARTVGEQYSEGSSVDDGALQPGDLLFFSTEGRGASHVGMAIGGDEFVHAPSSRGEVRVERLSAPYWSSRYVGARRVR